MGTGDARCDIPAVGHESQAMSRLGRIGIFWFIGCVGLYCGGFGPAMWWGERIVNPELIFRVYRPVIYFGYSEFTPFSTLVYRYGIWLNPDSKPMNIGFEEALPQLIERS